MDEGVPVGLQGLGDLLGQELAQGAVEDPEVPDRGVVVGLTAVELADEADGAGPEVLADGVLNRRDLGQGVVVEPAAGHDVVRAAVRGAGDDGVEGDHGDDLEGAALQHLSDCGIIAG